MMRLFKKSRNAKVDSLALTVKNLAEEVRSNSKNLSKIESLVLHFRNHADATESSVKVVAAHIDSIKKEIGSVKAEIESAEKALLDQASKIDYILGKLNETTESVSRLNANSGKVGDLDFEDMRERLKSVETSLAFLMADVENDTVVSTIRKVDSLSEKLNELSVSTQRVFNEMREVKNVLSGMSSVFSLYEEGSLNTVSIKDLASKSSESAFGLDHKNWDVALTANEADKLEH